ncbi:MAG: hypothetical protein ACYTKD_24235 [Planctomycetota bacterium]
MARAKRVAGAAALPAAAVLWALFMFHMACLRHSGIFDPLQFLWFVAFLLIGPTILVVGVVRFHREACDPEWRAQRLATHAAVFSLVVAMYVAYLPLTGLRLRIFMSVSEANEKLVRDAMRDHPEGQVFRLRGFRYPFWRLSGVPAAHEYGVMTITLPGSPGGRGRIAYSPEPPGPAGARHIGGPWYLLEPLR